jgi:hypothetical protein
MTRRIIYEKWAKCEIEVGAGASRLRAVRIASIDEMALH